MVGFSWRKKMGLHVWCHLKMSEKSHMHFLVPPLQHPSSFSSLNLACSGWRKEVGLPARHFSHAESPSTNRRLCQMHKYRRENELHVTSCLFLWLTILLGNNKMCFARYQRLSSLIFVLFLNFKAALCWNSVFLY